MCKLPRITRYLKKASNLEIENNINWKKNLDETKTTHVGRVFKNGKKVIHSWVK